MAGKRMAVFSRYTLFCPGRQFVRLAGQNPYSAPGHREQACMDCGIYYNSNAAVAPFCFGGKPAAGTVFFF